MKEHHLKLGSIPKPNDVFSVIFARNRENKTCPTLPISCQLAQDYPRSFPKQLQHPCVHTPSPAPRGGGVELASTPFDNLLNLKSKRGEGTDKNDVEIRSMSDRPAKN